MVHKLVKYIYQALRASNCAIRIVMGFGGAKLKGHPGQLTLQLRHCSSSTSKRHQGS